MLDLETINSASQDEFVAALGAIFEHSPWIAAETWPARPFASVAELHAAMCATVERAPAERRLALIRAHPDLAGKAAVAGELTAESTREQRSAGLSALTPDEFARFTELNTAYRERFGFPFVICAREHTKHSILENFAERLGHTDAQEVEAALGEVAKIARLRLIDAVRE